MNKIVMNVGMLSFFLSVIFFSQMHLPLIDVIIRSFVVFLFLTSMLSVLAIVFIRSINKKSSEKEHELSETLSGK